MQEPQASTPQASTPSERALQIALVVAMLTLALLASIPTLR